MSETKVTKKQLRIAIAALNNEVDRRSPCTHCQHRSSLHGRGYSGCWACDCGSYGEPPVAIEVRSDVA